MRSQILKFDCVKSKNSYISLIDVSNFKLEEAAGLLWDFYHHPLRSLTLLSLNVLSQNS